jgi:uncharacterized protein (TIGR03083 family)
MTAGQVNAQRATVVALPSREEVLAATDMAVRKLVADLETLSPDAWTVAACGAWTVDQTVAHLALGPIAYGAITDQMTEGGVEQLFDVTDPEFAETQLDLMGVAEPQERLDSVVGAFGQFAEAAWDVPAERLNDLTWTPEGVMPVAAALAIALNELVVHGYEVRLAAGIDPLPPAGDPAALAAFALYACTGLIREGGWLPVEVALGPAGPVVVSWDTERAVLQSGVDAAVRLQCSPGVFALLLWGRLTLDQAQAHGLLIDGPEAAVEAFIAATRPF